MYNPPPDTTIAVMFDLTDVIANLPPNVMQLNINIFLVEMVTLCLGIRDAREALYAEQRITGMIGVDLYHRFRLHIERLLSRYTKELVADDFMTNLITVTLPEPEIPGVVIVVLPNPQFFSRPTS